MMLELDVYTPNFQNLWDTRALFNAVFLRMDPEKCAFSFTIIYGKVTIQTLCPVLQNKTKENTSREKKQDITL